MVPLPRSCTRWGATRLWERWSPELKDTWSVPMHANSQAPLGLWLSGHLTCRQMFNSNGPKVLAWAKYWEYWHGTVVWGAERCLSGTESCCSCTGTCNKQHFRPLPLVVVCVFTKLYQQCFGHRSKSAVYHLELVIAASAWDTSSSVGHSCRNGSGSDIERGSQVRHSPDCQLSCRRDLPCSKVEKSIFGLAGLMEVK